MSITNGNVNNVSIIDEGGLAVAGAVTVYSNTFICPRDVTFGWELQFTSSGVVACTVEVEYGNTPPATEGAASANMVVGEGKRPLLTASDTNNHQMAYSPIVANFVRLKITGGGTNDASTVLSKALISNIVNS